MKKIFLLFSLLASLIIAQPFQIKQITSLNADCRNFTSTPEPFYFVFESYSDSSSSVYFGRYSPNDDSFIVLQKLTDDNFMNINPKLVYGNYDSLFLIYQTNKNGNWDIAYRVSWNNQPFSPVYYFADSLADEINPVVPTASSRFFSYQKGNSVYIREVSHSNAAAFEVFHGDDSTKYTQVSLEFSSSYPPYLYIAARKVANDKSFIVYKRNETNGWGNEIVLVSSGTCRNPKIQEINRQTGLLYTDDISGMSNIILIEHFSQPIDTLKLFDYPHYNYDNLLTNSVPILTKMQDIVINNPFTYKASWNDLLFIRVNKNELGPDLSDTLISTRVKDNNNLFLAPLGSTIGSNQVYYTIWEDSADGHIQLFGRRFLYHVSGVKDDHSPSAFTLYQNYPNPFNPTTTISYRLKENGFVKLHVYDITGKLIKTLVNQTKDPGYYETEFNAKGLASGVYFYRLEVFGKSSAPVFSDMKKTVLLK